MYDFFFTYAAQVQFYAGECSFKFLFRIDKLIQ